jgi:uncharacterized protein (TIRG00374 family)
LKVALWNGRHVYATLRWIAQGVVVVFLGWLVLRNIDPDRLLDALKRANWLLLVLAIVPLVIERIVRPIRLSILLGVPMHSLDIVAAQSVSQLVNLVLPLRSGELSLVILLGAVTPVSRSAAFSIVVIDRLFDIVCVLLVFAAALALVPDLPAAADQAAALLAVFVGLAIATMLILIGFRTAVMRQLDRFLPRLERGRADRMRKRVELIIDGFVVLRDPGKVLGAVITTVATWGLAVLGTWLVLRAFWPEAPVGASALAICFGVIGVTLVSVPAGIGVVHAAYVAAIVIFGATQEMSVAFAITAHFLATAVTAAMGVASLPVAHRVGISIMSRGSRPPEGHR